MHSKMHKIYLVITPGIDDPENIWLPPGGSVRNVFLLLERIGSCFIPFCAFLWNSCGYRICVHGVFQWLFVFSTTCFLYLFMFYCLNYTGIASATPDFLFLLWCRRSLMTSSFGFALSGYECVSMLSVWDSSEIIQNSLTGVFNLQMTIFWLHLTYSNGFCIPIDLYRNAKPFDTSEILLQQESTMSSLFQIWYEKSPLFALHILYIICFIVEC